MLTPLYEETIKAGNDEPRVDAELFEGFDYWFPSEHFAFAKRYVEGEVCLHVHLRNKAIAGDCCAIFERSGSPERLDKSGSGSNVLGSSHQWTDEIEFPVLIDDVEAMDTPKRVVLQPSSVRLQPLHLCEYAGIDSGEFAFRSPRPSRVPRPSL